MPIRRGAPRVVRIVEGLRGQVMTEMVALSAAGAVAFSDDGATIMDAAVMRRVLEYSRLAGAPVIVPAEDRHLVGEERHHLDLLRGERGPAVARDGQRAERAVGERERRNHLLAALAPEEPARRGEDRVRLAGELDLEAVERDHAP